MKKEQGFSLIELLIVVAIIAIIAAIAIPNLLTARQAANESSAIGSMRTYNAAQFDFSVAHGGDYGSLEDLVVANNLDSRWKTSPARINGYDFAEDEEIDVDDDCNITVFKVEDGGYGLKATPNGTSGRYEFGTAADGVIRYQGTVFPASTINAGDPIGS